MSTHDRRPIARCCPRRNFSSRGADDAFEALHAILVAILDLHRDAILERRSRLHPSREVDRPTPLAPPKP
ncbi:MAG: hypothetical protein MUF54_22920 [Polyangiaceae bacterium]|nr:hypothetical protein [Polyangiaceae bacterium]